MIPCADDGPDRIVEKQAEIEDMKHALKRLPEHGKYILYSFYGLGPKGVMTQRRIADELGISQSYVSRKLKTAKSRLRTEMERKYRNV
jgi:RNA polymerase sigma factor (sigma-70 family)